MNTLEITGETPADLVAAVTGIFGPRIVIPVEGEKDESVREVQVESLHNVHDAPLQTEARLDAAPEEKTQAVAAVEKVIADLRELRELSRWSAGKSNLMFSTDYLMQTLEMAARMLEIELTRREYHDLGNSIKDKQILQAVEHMG